MAELADRKQVLELIEWGVGYAIEVGMYDEYSSEDCQVVGDEVVIDGPNKIHIRVTVEPGDGK